jgi:hypothetical protein
MRVDNHVAIVKTKVAMTPKTVVHILLRVAAMTGGFKARMVMSNPKTMWNQPRMKISEYCQLVIIAQTRRHSRVKTICDDALHMVTKIDCSAKDWMITNESD